MAFNSPRLDYKIIFGMVDAGAKVLDLGCGEGELMFILAKEKKARVQGIEIDESSIYKCVEKGVSVFHGDIETGLIEYPDKAFDFVILNQSLQQLKKFDFALKEAFRVGHKVIVGFPNFAFAKGRADLALFGKAPETKSLPFKWYESPNVHFFSIKDFITYCGEQKIKILSSRYLQQNKEVRLFPNLWATDAIFLLTK